MENENNDVNSNTVSDVIIVEKIAQKITKPTITFSTLEEEGRERKEKEGKEGKEKDIAKSKYSTIKSKIDLCLGVIATVARMYGGFMVGGVVRDYIILGHAAKDIDIRFPSFDDLDKFLLSLRLIDNISIVEQYENKSHTLFVKKCQITLELTDAYYSFDVDTITKKNMTSIDYDFIVNGITYDGINFGFIDNDDELLRLAMTHIEQKIMVPNPKLLIRSIQNLRRKQCYIYRISKFKARGWTIIDEDKILDLLQ
jgi:hypothetical protein